MIYRISLLLFSLLISFSSLAAGNEHNIDGSLTNKETATATDTIDFLPALITAGADIESISNADCSSELQKFSGEKTLAQSGCCRICTVGKACGNSCISRSYTCHKGRGCACNG